VGLIPLTMNVMYNLATAFFQVSGLRFVLPVQWIAYFYFALGLMAIVQFLWGLFTSRQPAPAGKSGQRTEGSPVRRLAWWQAALVLALFTLAGSSLILIDVVVPQHFAPQSQAQILTELTQMPAIQADAVLREALLRLPAESGLQIYKGRAIYPRYYGQDEVEPDTAKTAYATLNYPRMVFFFLSHEINLVAALPVAETPGHFPHPMDIILVGCPQDLMIEARLVAALDGSEALYVSNLSELTASCAP
jgi:hypothetical protein